MKVKTKMDEVVSKVKTTRKLKGKKKIISKKPSINDIGMDTIGEENDSQGGEETQRDGKKAEITPQLKKYYEQQEKEHLGYLELLGNLHQQQSPSTDIFP